MANYKVLLSVGARPIPSMNSTSKYQVSVGYMFTSSVVKADTTYGLPYLVQMPDGNYIPLTYNGKEYCREEIVVPPPPPPPSSTGTPFTLAIQGFKSFSGILIPEV